jgi:hypothetical protein
VVARLGEHVGEHSEQIGVGVDVANPAAFVVVTQHDLGYGQADQFTISEIGTVAPTCAGRDYEVVDQHVQCGQEGVQVFRHTLIMDTLLPCPDTGPTSHDLHGITHLVWFAAS